MKTTFLKHITQLFLIVFSVVLGLYLSERLEERKNQKEAQELMLKIKSEVKENKKILEYWLPYHQQIVVGLDSLITDEKFVNGFIEDQSVLFDAVLTRGNLMGDNIANDAWDIAKSHPLIVNIDYDQLLALSRIYSQQEGTYKPVPQIIELFLSSEFNAKDKAKQNLNTFKRQMREVVSRETQLMRFYENAETVLGL